MNKQKCRIFINDCGSFKVPTGQTASADFSRRVDKNTGNILIHDYATRRLDYAFDYEKSFDTPADCFMILAANCLRPQTKLNWESWFKFLRRQPKIWLMGLGAQAVLENMRAKEYAANLPRELVRWVKMIADCSESIGIRGEFTADVVSCLGIKNAEVIGCPTWYVNGYNQPLITRGGYTERLRPVFHTAWQPYTPWHSAWHKAVLDNMLNLTDPRFVMQSEFEFVPYMVANKDMMQFCSFFTPEELRRSSEAVKAHFALSDCDVYEDGRIKNMFAIFSDITEWEKFVKTRDVSFGFRIHGSVIALKNGVPAICIVSDSRTYELCSFFKIPFVRVNEISSDTLNFREIYEKADFSGLNREYPRLLRNYINFLNKNGIRHKFE